MQLGTRWTAGDEPPASVPPALREQIAAVEQTITDRQLDGVGRPKWTLTFLEGRPVAELDSGVIVELGRDGQAVVRKDDERGLD